MSLLPPNFEFLEKPVLLATSKYGDYLYHIGRTGEGARQQIGYISKVPLEAPPELEEPPVPVGGIVNHTPYHGWRFNQEFRNLMRLPD
ncbi:MAG: hypothetical protein F6K42_31140 [Leptolyngbya sp. SIO1D8]|nr:hypothetical protein [Leptolyngbya sp. SIO1D8]